MLNGGDVYCHEGRLFWELGHMKLTWDDAWDIVLRSIERPDAEPYPFAVEGQGYSLLHHLKANRWTLRHLGRNDETWPAR